MKSFYAFRPKRRILAARPSPAPKKHHPPPQTARKTVKALHHNRRIPAPYPSMLAPLSVQQKLLQEWEAQLKDSGISLFGSEPSLSPTEMTETEFDD